jgi:hypothetical protein
MEDQEHLLDHVICRAGRHAKASRVAVHEVEQLIVSSLEGELAAGLTLRENFDAR